MYFGEGDSGIKDTPRKFADDTMEGSSVKPHEVQQEEVQGPTAESGQSQVHLEDVLRND